MDEASQIRPEDALGAVARGRQLVVVGDTKQMPPSSLFQTESGESDIEEQENSAAQNSESVLECSLHAFAPVYRLKWHYRSQHEDLIKFSNHHYYDNDLVVFPAARKAGTGLGVVFHYIEGAVYLARSKAGARTGPSAPDPGAALLGAPVPGEDSTRKGAGTLGGNDLEAKAVAEAAIAHLLKHPGQSLLVATMNIRQQELVEDWIDRLTTKDPQARKAVEEASARDSEEFSVKNLENIQGHQRDVVMISMTYGKDPDSGKVAQRFGPLNGRNGRRRLNVLFTRAKLRNEVFSSMTYKDIVSKPEGTSGVNDLRDYLRFAQEGALPGEEGANPSFAEGRFEESVIHVVRSCGLLATPRIGVASYRVDIGVSLPERPQDYILGIECDGAAYHAMRSTRDRDRLRDEVLRSRGWNLHRIWSIDWFQQHEQARQSLVQVLESARAAALGQHQLPQKTAG
jgi:hypothetical protein